MPVTRVSGNIVRDDDITDADIDAANKDGLAAVPSMRTLGVGAQQAAAGNDQRLALSRSSFRHSQLSFGNPRFYVCGQVRASGGTPNSAIPLNTLFFMPFITSPDTSGTFTIRGIGIGNTNAPGATTFNVGIYDSPGANDIRPQNLIAQLGVTSLNTYTPPVTVTGLSIPLAPNQLHWLALVFGGASPTCRTLNTASAHPILGYSASFTTAPSAGIGHTQVFAVGPLPATIAAAGLSPITSNGTPFMLFGV